MSEGTTIHATAVLVGRHAVLIRGPAGSGKSRLALALIEAGRTGALPFTRLVADDRVALAVHDGRLLVSPPTSLAGMIEVRNLGIRRLPYEPIGMIGLVVDLSAPAASRLPEVADQTTILSGIVLPHIALPVGVDPWQVVAAYVRGDSTEITERLRR